jgi:hypothetical protein
VLVELGAFRGDACKGDTHIVQELALEKAHPTMDRIFLSLRRNYLNINTQDSAAIPPLDPVLRGYEDAPGRRQTGRKHRLVTGP